ncbi:helix-turn-helix domain-containing protein [Microbacterium paraoxydans]|uniref:helix-turn-helix domain-containing protein n=1 Tax=Microbacterium paraoxydans TaxID=199592 RepID=UPI0030136FC0
MHSSSIEIPAPVAADLIDASNDITTTLNMWANHVAGEDRPGAGLAAGVMADAAHDVVRMATDVILDELENLANDSHQIEALCEGVMAVHQGAPNVWTVADAAVRWPLEDSPRWAQAPCPECDLMAVRVQPGRNGRPSRYRCATPECDWEANSNDDGGLWASVFAEPAPPEILPQERRGRMKSWLTLAEAAEVTGRTERTIRNWVSADELRPRHGRYMRDEVLATERRMRRRVGRPRKDMERREDRS